MKNIAFITNVYGDNWRQNIALESIHRTIEDKKNIKCFLIQFKDECVSNKHNFEIIPDLKRSSLDYFNTSKKLPFINDIFEIGSNLDFDYFVFINSDIIIDYKILNYILLENPEAIAFSRGEASINSNWNFDSPLNISRISVAGFDAFVFENNWYQKNKKLFKDMYLGRPVFDNCYSSLMTLFSKNILNNRDCFIYHPIHDLFSNENDDMYNHNFEVSKKIYADIMNFWRLLETETIRKRPDQSIFFKHDAKEPIKILELKEKFLKDNEELYKKLIQ